MLSITEKSLYMCMNACSYSSDSYFSSPHIRSPFPYFPLTLIAPPLSSPQQHSPPTSPPLTHIPPLPPPTFLPLPPYPHSYFRSSTIHLSSRYPRFTLPTHHHSSSPFLTSPLVLLLTPLLTLIPPPPLFSSVLSHADAHKIYRVSPSNTTSSTINTTLSNPRLKVLGAFSLTPINMRPLYY